AFFQKGVGQMFPTSSRQYDIYFRYPWVEEDQVLIELPEGYALDNAEQPGDLNFGDVGYCKINIGVTQNQRTLEYKRNFRFTGLIFPKAAYPNLKQAFDVLHQRDNHTITLKQGAAPAARPYRRSEYMWMGLFVCFSAASLLNRPALADDPPAWLKQAAATNVPTYSKEVHAVVLQDESRKTVEEDGRVRTVDYFAVRILSREGRKEAVARAGYSTDFEKVKEMRAWLIRPNGE